ncbi:chondroitin AC/alginate lyase [Lasiosphaeris hirsuta]|uniref:Chondroitin AC/alginate lyase n=1 Tax=Lasiosphaeris hirsuta TaxID=260670 RepID=A0AA40AIB1_9PEZI|nr:chondroitin AC/alginate lyase [Lasiosphaeris hirsuta]
MAPKCNMLGNILTAMCFLATSCALRLSDQPNHPLHKSDAAPISFKHPGVFITKPQLEFVRTQVRAGAEPWSTAYKSMLAHDLAKLSRNPSPQAAVKCDSGSSEDQGNGCHNERQDALAAWAMAVAYHISGDAKYAQKSMSYLNAWSAALRSHAGSNANLQIGWAGTSWVRAAELIRYSGAGWSDGDIAAFENMVRSKFLPTAAKSDNRIANWDLVLLETAVEAAVFLDDRNTYDAVSKLFVEAVPAYIYLSSDGQYPKAARGKSSKPADLIKAWFNQTRFVDGLEQETCRDLVHTGYGIASIAHFAETAWIQGDDYYTGDVGRRLLAALEFHTKFLNGEAVPNWLCGGAIPKMNDDGAFDVTEVGLNALGTRLGLNTQQTGRYTQRTRPHETNWLFIGWETVTHARNPTNASAVVMRGL